MKFSSTFERALLALGVAAIAPWSEGQPTLTDLGTLPGGTYSWGYGINSDGSVACGVSDDDGPRAVLWTSFGIQDLGMLPGFQQSYGMAVSKDGGTIVGVSLFGPFGHRAFYWSASEGMVDLGILPGANDSWATCVSGDGSRIVGRCLYPSYAKAFLWTAPGDMKDLGVLPGGTSAEALGVSSDGLTVVGTSVVANGNKAFVWVEGSGMKPLGSLNGQSNSRATGSNADGSVIVGDSATGLGNAFRWVAGGGLQDLGTMSGGTGSSANSVSSNGSVVVGVCFVPGTEGRAFVWTPGLGLLDLQAYLGANGVDVTNWVLREATCVSADGTAVVGLGKHEGNNRAWLVTGLPTPPIERLSPYAQVVSRGRVTKGGLGSLTADDSVPEIVCKFVLPNQNSPFISTQLAYKTTKYAPSSMTFEVKAKWNNGGNYKVRFLQFDFALGLDVETLPETPLSGSYSVFSGSATGDLSHFVDQSNGEARSRITVRQVGPASALLPCVSLEYANLVVSS